MHPPRSLTGMCHASRRYGRTRTLFDRSEYGETGVRLMRVRLMRVRLMRVRLMRVRLMRVRLMRVRLMRVRPKNVHLTHALMLSTV